MTEGQNQTGVTITNPPIIKQIQIGYIKPIQRRGNTYMIRDSLPSEDDLAENNGTEQMINDLYIDSLKLSSTASHKASLFKTLYTLCSFIMIIIGAVVGIMSIGDDYIVAVLGFIVTGIQTFLTTFSIERRGVLLKDTSNKLKRISRQVRSLQITDMNPRDKMKKLEEYYTEVDELDLNMFENKITTDSLSKGTNIINSSQPNTRQPTSNLSSEDDTLYEDSKRKGPILPVTVSDIKSQPSMLKHMTK